MITLLLRVKWGVLAVAVLAFLIYMPIGGLLACPKKKSPEGLEDYSDCPEIFTVRIICQVEYDCLSSCDFK